MNFVDFITSKANQCGWKITEVLSDTLVSLGFDTDSGSETILISPCGKNSDGNTVLEFVAPGFPVPNDKELAGGMALILLERNDNMLSGFWAIKDFNNGERQFTLQVTQIANTMDKDEFRSAIRGLLNEKEKLQKLIQKHAVDF